LLLAATNAFVASEWPSRSRNPREQELQIFRQALSSFLSSFLLVLSSFSKHFFGGFVGFKGLKGRKFAFLRDSKFLGPIAARFRQMVVVGRDAWLRAKGGLSNGEAEGNQKPA
jgi:hypothetical protein